MASKKRSASAKDPLQVHATVEYRRGKAPGIIVRQGGGDEDRYLEFVLPDKQRSVKVEWNSEDFGCSARKGEKGVPVRLIVDNGRPRPLTYKNGAFYEKGRSKPVVDKKAADIGKRFVELGFTNQAATRSLQNRGGADPTGWFGCVSDKTQAGAGLGAAVGGVGGLVAGGVAGAATGAGAGGGLGAAAGACFGLGWCTAEAIWG